MPDVYLEHNPPKANLGNFADQLLASLGQPNYDVKPYNLGNFANQLHQPTGFSQGGIGSQVGTALLSGLANGLQGLGTEDEPQPQRHIKLSQDVPNKHWKLSKWLASFL